MNSIKMIANCTCDCLNDNWVKSLFSLWLEQVIIFGSRVCSGCETQLRQFFCSEKGSCRVGQEQGRSEARIIYNHSKSLTFKKYTKAIVGLEIKNFVSQGQLSPRGNKTYIIQVRRKWLWITIKEVLIAGSDAHFVFRTTAHRLKMSWR